MKLDEEETEEYDRYVEDRFHTIQESLCFSMGRLAGEMIGWEDGMQEGAQKERIELIKKLLAADISIKQIAPMIGITPDEVEDLLLIDP